MKIYRVYEAEEYEADLNYAYFSTQELAEKFIIDVETNPINMVDINTLSIEEIELDIVYQIRNIHDELVYTFQYSNMQKKYE